MAHPIDAGKAQNVARVHVSDLEIEESSFGSASILQEAYETEMDIEKRIPIDELAPLSESVSGLGQVLGELKEQLTQMVRVNQALEKDLEETREELEASNRERTRLKDAIEEMEEEFQVVDDLRSEVKQLTIERDTLSDRLHDISEMLAKSEKRVLETSALLDRFRTERNDASAEAACLDSQFSRAMKVVEELRTSLSEGTQREEEQQSMIRALKEQLERAMSDRDTFKAELLDSRNTLEEVRQSILAVGQE